MTVDTICEAFLQALKNARYNASTIRNYQGVTRRFKSFCTEHNVTDYNCDIGKLYAEYVVSPKTGKYSVQRSKIQGRFIRLLDSHNNAGKFDFSMKKKSEVQPNGEYYRQVYSDYCSYLSDKYEIENTQHFYKYGMYVFLSYLETDYPCVLLDELSPEIIISYIKQTKATRLRETLCELRNIFNYLGRNDLVLLIAGMHAPRHHRIITVLDTDEQEKIKDITNEDTTPLRDTAMIMLGLSTGIRACDIITLKLSDIDWRNDTISWRQSKTGNLVVLPLTPAVGNAIARYLTEQRPDTDNDYLFVRLIAPYTPLSCHASCYGIIKRILEKAKVSTTNRMLGMHMLRKNAASTMVKNEVPIETIAAVLGHSDPDSTDIYITTDEKKLRECVLPFSGISKEVNKI